MYNIGIIYADGEFSKHRKSELMGSEVIYIKNTLLKQFEVNNVHILATANNSEADIQINNSDELNKYDILILFWSSTNQWGGELNYSQYLVYKFLHNYSGMILYWLEDSRFPCTQLIDVIAERKWWKENPLCNNEELKLPSNIHMLSMFNDI